jgi:hypothetical protein
MVKAADGVKLVGLLGPKRGPTALCAPVFRFPATSMVVKHDGPGLPTQATLEIELSVEESPVAIDEKEYAPGSRVIVPPTIKDPYCPGGKVRAWPSKTVTSGPAGGESSRSGMGGITDEGKEPVGPRVPPLLVTLLAWTNPAVT